MSLATVAQRYHEMERDGSASWECLMMVREELEAMGVKMDATPPMFFNDAIRSVVSRLGRKAGMTTWAEVRAFLSSKDDSKLEVGHERGDRT